MNIYDEANELLEPIDLTLDMMKKFIQPTIFEGLKSNIESIKHTIKKHEERAKKVEELLGLYRESHRLTQVYQHLKNLLRFKNKKTHQEEYFQMLVVETELDILKYEIKTLEEELE